MSYLKSILIIIAVSFLVGSIGIAKAKEIETYEVGGMEFTVGKHEPKQRVNPKKEEVKMINQAIVVDKEAKLDEKIEEKINEKLGNDKNKDENNLSDDEDEEGYFMKTIKEILISIKDLWAELTTFEEKIENRLDSIEDKLDTNTDKSVNGEELTI